MTVDRLKILKGNAAYPRGGICKICGFSDADLPGDQRTCFRFSDVCGDHDCLVKAGVCDCIACQKKSRKIVTEDEKELLRRFLNWLYEGGLEKIEAKFEGLTAPDVWDVVDKFGKMSGGE